MNKSSLNKDLIDKIKQASANVGVKFDDFKLMYDLVDPYALAWLVASLTYGSTKYARDNWRKVDGGRARYSASLMRHFELWRAGEDYDEESGLPHLAMASFSMMCLTAMYAPRDMGFIQKRTRASVEHARQAKKVVAT